MVSWEVVVVLLDVLERVERMRVEREESGG